MDNSTFIEQIAAYVQKYAHKYGICVHSPIIAQGILESDSGKSYKATFGHNYHGLKYRKNRVPVSIGKFTDTSEEDRGDHNEKIVDEWFKFANMEDGIHGYFQFINIANYDNLKGVTDPRKYVENIKADGYATDENYVEKIMNVIKTYNLTKYDKTEGKSMFKVCIDAGHYAKYNRSPGNSKYYESEVMWKLHLLLKSYLEALGIEVVTTRSNASKDLELHKRGQKAKGCDLFISLHSNAVGSAMNESIDYAAIYHLTDDTTTKADDISKEFAKIIAPVIANLMGTKQGYKVLTRKSSNDRNNDGMFNDNYYGVLHGARLVNVPGLILEHSFHTNSAAVKWLLDENNLDKLAKAEAECIASYLKGEKVTTPEAPKPAEKQEAATNASYAVKITASSLNIRAGVGISTKIVGCFTDNQNLIKGNPKFYYPKGVYTIVEEKDGWGKLKSGIGWISLNYTKKV